MRIWEELKDGTSRPRDRLISFHYGYYPAYLFLVLGLLSGAVVVAISRRLRRPDPLILLLPIAALMLFVLWTQIVPKVRHRTEYLRQAAEVFAPGKSVLREELVALDESARRLGLKEGEAILLQRARYMPPVRPHKKRGMPASPLPAAESEAAGLARELFQWDAERKILFVRMKDVDTLNPELRAQVQVLGLAYVAHVRHYDLLMDGMGNPRLEHPRDPWLWLELLNHIRRPRLFVCYNIAPPSSKMIWLYGRFLGVKPLRATNEERAVWWTQLPAWQRTIGRMMVPEAQWGRDST